MEADNVVELDRRTIPREVAEAEFSRFCEVCDVDTDEEFMDDKETEGFRDIRRNIVRSISRGDLTLDDDGLPTFTPRFDDNRDPLTFCLLKGGVMMSLDPDRKNKEVAKVLGRLTKQHPRRFAEMDYRDFRVCNSILNVFLD